MMHRYLGTLSRGAVRVSSRELLMEMDRAVSERGGRASSAGSRSVPLVERLPGDVRARLEEMRRGEY